MDGWMDGWRRRNHINPFAALEQGEEDKGEEEGGMGDEVSMDGWMGGWMDVGCML